MERSKESAEEVLCRLNDCLVQLQAIIKCSICCSTLRNPVTPSCNHAFCKECIESVFQRRASIECPVCRQLIKRRSTRSPSEHIGAIVTNYLQLVQNFKGEIKASNAIPKDKFILESQALTQMTDSPLKTINFQEPTITMRKKRKLEEEDVGRSKLAKVEEEEFVVPRVSFAIKTEDKPLNKNKRRAGTARTLQLTEPIPMTPAPEIRIKLESEVEKEPIGKPPVPHRSVSVPTESPTRRSTRVLNRKSSITPPPTPQKRMLTSSPCRNRIARENDVNGNFEEKPMIRLAPPVGSIRSSEKSSSRSVKIGTEMVTFPMAVQCNLMPNNLDEAIQRQKNEDRTSNDIKAFFTLFPTARKMFKDNLPILLRELGMRPYIEPNTSRILREGQQTLKFEVLLDEDGAYLSDDDATEAMLNRSIPPSPITPHRNAKAPTVQQENEPIVSHEDVVPASEEVWGGVLDQIKEECSGSRVVAPSETTRKHRIAVGCQTDFHLLSSLPYFALPSKNDTDGCGQIKVEPGQGTEASEEPILLDSDENIMEGAGEPVFEACAPAEYVIAVSKRESEADNDLLRRFRQAFNVKIRTEINSKTTHLIMMDARDSNSKSKSVNFSIAICRRVEILNRLWIEDSLLRSDLLDSRKYRIRGQTYQPWFYSPTIQPLQLFEGCRFYIPQKYFPNEQGLSREAVIRLVVWAGGTVFQRLEELVDTQEAERAGQEVTMSAKRRSNFFGSAPDQMDTKTMIIFSPLCADLEAARRLKTDLEISVVSATYLLDSICSGCRLDYRNFLVA